MQVILHTGAHHTDEDRLLKCLLSNKEDFSKRGVAVPGPGKYRTLLKDSFLALDAAEPSADARDVLVDAILDDEQADRLILSNANFFGSPRFALGGGQLYPLAELRLSQVTRLFAPDGIEMFMAICNPATFVPNVLSKANDGQKADILAESDPRGLRWSEMISRIRDALPGLPITVWCNEDSPLIWSQIIREIGGIDEGETVKGGFDLLRDIMTKEGMQRLRTYLHERKELTEPQKRRVIMAFLDKFAIEGALEEELDLPGWTEDLVDELTGTYDRDLQVIQGIPGVRVIAP